MRASWLVACVLCAGVFAPAQTTWVVDIQNAAGAHFTELPAAVAAAADGERIVVRGRGSAIG